MFHLIVVAGIMIGLSLMAGLSIRIMRDDRFSQWRMAIWSLAVALSVAYGWMVGAHSVGRHAEYCIESAFAFAAKDSGDDSLAHSAFYALQPDSVERSVKYFCNEHALVRRVWNANYGDSVIGKIPVH